MDHKWVAFACRLCLYYLTTNKTTITYLYSRVRSLLSFNSWVYERLEKQEQTQL